MKRTWLALVITGLVAVGVFAIIIFFTQSVFATCPVC